MSEHVWVNVADSCFLCHTLYQLVIAVRVARPAEVINDDKFLPDQLFPEAFEAACAAAGQPLTLRRHAGYDHGYYFIATVIDDHLKFHHEALISQGVTP